MARAAGMKSVRLIKCHYIADGVFDALARERDYSDAAARARLSRIEMLARELPVVKHLARASLVVGVVGA